MKKVFLRKGERAAVLNPEDEVKCLIWSSDDPPGEISDEDRRIECV